MKNKLIIILLSFLIKSSLFANSITIQSNNISLDKNKEISIFEKNVEIVTENNNKIKSDYAEYNKKTGFLRLKNNIVAINNEGDIIETEYAEYNEKTKIFLSIGPTKIITSKNYILEGSDIKFDNLKNFIISNKNAIVTDKENNKIYLENYEYLIEENIFKSVGKIEIVDSIDNKYEFSQLYIDTNKKEILGSDIKAYINNEDFKINKANKPRIFANTLKISETKSLFNKSVFTICDYRKNDKCPPWSIRAKKMLHDNKTKTIYYDNALIKVYDIPIFYMPKLSHPDPTVDRRSGFLPPILSNTKNLGSSVSVPYFWAISPDKNFTVTNQLFVSENPLFLGEYHQAYKNASLLADFGYTKGYKKNVGKKKTGEKSHFFSKLVKNFSKVDSESTLSVSIQNVSNDKYLKLYKIDSKLVDKETDTLENSVNFIHEDEKTFFGLNLSVFETLNENYNDKYEYILPELTLDKNLISDNRFGNLDLQSNYKVHNYDTNKYTNFFINDFDWNLKEIFYKSGLKSKFLFNFKNINYETRNVDLYKKNTTTELYGAFGYFNEFDLERKTNFSQHKLKPKILFRYAPGGMRKLQNSDFSRLNPDKAFSIDRINNINNFETGLSSTIGFDYKIKKDNKEFDFSLAQIINEKENKKMSSLSSMDEKMSDVVGTANYSLSDNSKVYYNFSVDQNYNDFNYNEIGTTLDLNPIKFDFNYLQEQKHIGDQEYFQTKIDFFKNTDGVLSFETKRNLVTNSSEFYNLSYEYLNDCLRAGLVYRREFYTDSELEPENSLMFKITLVPFGSINSPSFAE